MTRPPPGFVPPESQIGEPWDDAEAERLIKKYALVGVTWVSSDGETVTAKGQYHGRIAAIDRTTGVVIACEGRWEGQTLTLPPATSWFESAQPGRYNLKSTGEVVVDPDVTATWLIRAAS